jgi:hypothetical protein
MATSMTDTSAPAGSRRARVRAAAHRVLFGAEALAAGVGGAAAWQAHVAGQAVSRPAAVSLGAGLVGLAASLLAPRIRAYVQRRRAGGA